MNEVVIVSGLPRSGTSLLMQILNAGGFPVVTDNVRIPDVDNPKGYFEFEPVKKIEQDSSWISEMRGKAFKMVSQLLYKLPTNENYKIIFMTRDMDEMLSSQEKMLKRLGKPSVPISKIKPAYRSHLESLHAWMRKQRNICVLDIAFKDLFDNPQQQVQRVSEFLSNLNIDIDMDKAVATIDPTLYRNRS